MIEPEDDLSIILKNLDLIDSYTKNLDTSKLNSISTILHYWGKFFIEDSNKVLSLIEEQAPSRYLNMVLRSMIEQLAEGIQLINSPKYRKSFFNFSEINKIDIKKINSNYSQEEFITIISKICGQNRFSDSCKRPKITVLIQNIPSDISAPIADDTNLSLLTIYKTLSEEEHNSYYNALDDHMLQIDYGIYSLYLLVLSLAFVSLIIHTNIKLRAYMLIYGHNDLSIHEYILKNNKKRINSKKN